MPFSLYKRLDLNKLTPTEISLQMADKSTAIPIGICEDVPVFVANVTILTDFVIVDIPEDNSMSSILGRPFLNTAGAVIDCTKANVTFHVMEMSIWYTFRGNNLKSTVSILLENFQQLLLEVLNFLFLLSRKKYDILIIGDVHIPVEVT